MNHYLKSLPRKRCGVGVLMRDTEGRLLILKPTYRDEWLIPGGVVEENESPRKAALRETEEELGLTPGNLEFLLVDYTPAEGEKDEGFQFPFEAKGAADASAIRLSEEHGEFRFLADEEAIPMLAPRLKRRLRLVTEGIRGYTEGF